MWVTIGWLILIIFTICNYLIYKSSGINIGGALIPWIGGILIISMIGIWARYKYEDGASDRESRKLATEEAAKNQREQAYSQRLELRDEIQHMPKYDNWRQEVFEKCGKRCEICGASSGLEIHHKISFDKIIRINKIKNTYEALGCEALWYISNGSVLCHGCHEKMESSLYRKNAGT